MRLPPGAESIASNGESVDARLAGPESAGTLTSGSREVKVAVIDTGCDIHHPDLRNSLWHNPGESGLDARGNNKATNGIDDDHNGFVDDLYGWNFVNDNPDVTDSHGHGTHIAGIIAAEPNSSGGSRGVAPGVSLMILKYYDTSSNGMYNLTNTVAAIHYAIQMGANIINYSGGGVLRSEEEEAALALAKAHGILVVAAAGNDGMNTDFHHFYPADYDLTNILAVGATDRDERLLRMSNFGRSTVDVVAPGKNIYSTLPNGLHGYMSGTSQATAFATGVAAALISSRLSGSNPEEVIRRMLAASTHRASLEGKIKSGGLLDVQTLLGNSEQEIASGSDLARRPAQAN
jgi:subtilisin family serine protease